MGLKRIQDDGTFHWHCDSPTCQYHNCAHPISDPGKPEDYPNCVHHTHLSQGERPAGEPLSAHVSHESVVWSMCGTMIALPVCAADGCSRQTSAKVVFTAQELQDGMIDEKEEYIEKVVDPDREEMRLALKALGHEMPQRIQLVKRYRVTGQHQHPQIERHMKLAELVKSIGKLPPAQED